MGSLSGVEARRGEGGSGDWIPCNALGEDLKGYCEVWVRVYTMNRLGLD